VIRTVLEDSRSSEKAPVSRLRARVFYGIIVAGVLAGAVACAATGWIYLESATAKPTGRRIWDGVAEQFVVPICVMIGATFGGLLGLLTAIAADFRTRRRHWK
jgi:hypothetical protein